MRKKRSWYSDRFVVSDRSGVSALPTILLISAILIEVVVVGTILANTLNNTRLSERLAAEAFAAARTGAQDAVLRVIRHKNCPSDPGSECPSNYTLTVGSRTVNVTTTDSGGGIITIESTGSAFTRQKKIQAVLGVDSNTGELSLQSFKEVAL